MEKETVEESKNPFGVDTFQTGFIDRNLEVALFGDRLSVDYKYTRSTICLGVFNLIRPSEREKAKFFLTQLIRIATTMLSIIDRYEEQ